MSSSDLDALKASALEALNARDASAGTPITSVVAGTQELSEADADAMGFGPEGGVPSDAPRIPTSGYVQALYDQNSIEHDAKLRATAERTRREQLNTAMSRARVVAESPHAPVDASRQSDMLDAVCTRYERLTPTIQKAFRGTAGSLGLPMPPNRLGGAWEVALDALDVSMRSRSEPIRNIVNLFLSTGRSWGVAALTSAAASLHFFALLHTEIISAATELEEPSESAPTRE